MPTGYKIGKENEPGSPFYMTQLFKDYSEWIYRGIMLAVVCTTLWLNSHYVTVESYELDKKEATTDRKIAEELASKRLTAIETVIQVMAESNKVNDRQDLALRDLELRVRTLETKSR